MKSPLTYVGGKSKLSRTIIGLIPEHKTYCEVFAGALWVFFGKEPSKYEVVNDLDSDLIAFYRVVQNHFEEFIKQFKWLLVSREQFEDWNDQIKGRGLTDIQRAARYYYIQRLCFGGRVKGRTYGTTPDSKPRINLVRMEEELSAVHLRLSDVMIENLAWDDVIGRYDKPKTFFYLDPPYHSEPCYKHNLGLDDYRHMAEALKGIQGKFILSLNDHPEIRNIFRVFTITPVALSYSIAREKATQGRELLILNY